MKNILIHGLGQNQKSWDEVIEHLEKNSIEVLCPNLFALSDHQYMDYRLALDYVKRYPDTVNSIIIIGTPYVIPKAFFKIQNMMFRFMPKSTFNKMGCSKDDCIHLVHSMSDLNIKKDLNKVKCRCLILCGVKDRINRKSVHQLHDSIMNSELHIIDNASHEVNVENPQALAHIMSAFWKESL